MDAEEPTIGELWKLLESWEDVEGVWSAPDVSTSEKRTSNE